MVLLVHTHSYFKIWWHWQKKVQIRKSEVDWISGSLNLGIKWWICGMVHWTDALTLLCWKITRSQITDNSRPMRPRSRSFKVINFCCNQKPIYDFLLVDNCHISSISHHFWNTASQCWKPPDPTWAPRSRGPFRILSSYMAGRVRALGYIIVKNCMILAAVVLSQYTRVTDRQTDDRQMTDDRQHIMTIAKHCNNQLKITN